MVSYLGPFQSLSSNSAAAAAASWVFQSVTLWPVTLRTHSGTHFELGFSVNAIATLGRKAIEQHGEKSDNLEVFEHRLFRLTRLHIGGGELTAQISCKTEVWGWKHEGP